MNYVFVCTGNTCRSPMAQAFMNRALKAMGKPQTASSCGIMAYEGAPANDCAIQTMLMYGIDLSGHSARRISAEILMNATILCMDKNAAVHVKNAYPNQNVHDLCAYAGVKGCIEDPYGMGMGAYVACAEKLEMIVNRILHKGA